MKTKAKQTIRKQDAPTPGRAVGRVVLVGTYKGDQLTHWNGWYNYPLSNDKAHGHNARTIQNFSRINELWLFLGTKEQRNYKAEFVGIKTREELIRNYGYPAKGRAHGEKYLLFRTEFLYLNPSDFTDSTVERVIIRTADFAKRSPQIAKQLKAFLESADRDNADLAKRLPSILTRLRPDRLRVCEQAVQLDFSKELFHAVGDTISCVCDRIGCKANTPAWPDAFGSHIKAICERLGNNPIRTLSLFSGAGGLDIGFTDAGFEIVESVEIEDKFCETLEMNSGVGKRFAGSHVNCIDIRDYSSKTLGKVDFIIGGPPCQTFSAAGRRANGVLGTADARGILFREYVRLLKELSPVGFLFENVYGITGAQNGEAWNEIKDAFRAAGYRLFFRILDAADYGVPQHRERLIIVGLKSGEFRFPRPTHGPDSIDGMPFYNAGTAVEGVPLTAEEAKPGLGGRFGHLLPDIPPGLNYSFYTEKLGHPNPVFAWRSKFSDFLYKADPSAPVRTIKASGGAYTGPLHWSNRFFALGEYKRLQTFPDDYAISGSKQIAVKQIGNSVPPQLARILAIAIQTQVFHARLPFQLPLLEKDEVLSFRKRKSDLTREYQGKAARAIGKKTCETVKKLSDTSYFCSLSDSFRFEKTSALQSEFAVSFDSKKGLAVRESANPEKQSPVRMIIHVSPNGDGWILGTDKVDIEIRSDKEKAFTVGWKAFEQLVADNNVKADLVQLNGYYQYSPKLRCSCEFFGDFRFKHVVASVVAGHDVARILSTQELAEDWNMSDSEVWFAAEFLRTLGYEVRNSNTNPQIPQDHWLVPYAFPTFTQRSVQLRKKLR